MNDEAREVLVAAALRGHKQARGALHDVPEGECALGVLHLAVHPTRDRAMVCAALGGGHCEEMERRFAIGYFEAMAIASANDEEGWDFLTIARKIGVKEDE